MFRKILKGFLWTGAAVLAAYFIVVIARIPHAYNQQKTEEAVAKIHATKLTLDDVMGKNLPPDPGAEADKTIAGIDTNSNGIRDDIELAIFKEYPNSAKTRAVLLQYALALQMEVIQPIVNTGTVTEVLRENSRTGDCIADMLVPRKTPESTRNYSDIEKINAYINFVENKQLNTAERRKADQDFYKNLGSYSESTNTRCDIDSATLPN